MGLQWEMRNMNLTVFLDELSGKSFIFKSEHPSFEKPDIFHITLPITLITQKEKVVQSNIIKLLSNTVMFKIIT